MDTQKPVRKRCFKCGKVRTLSMFYKHKNMADGHLNKCKDCTKADVLAYQTTNRDSVRAYDRDRYNNPERKANVMQSQRTRREKYPGKAKARWAVHNAIRDGKLVKQPCEVCGSTERIQAHHDDYRKPLAVRWLCFVCHRKAHGQYRELA